MQYNFFTIELLGEEELKGVSIPVIVDSKKDLTEDQMANIAKVLNSYRTVFVRSNVADDSLDTRVFSVRGETFDCFYAGVAALYSLTQSSYIREIQSGQKYVTINEYTKKNRVAISYENMAPTGVSHEIPFMDLEIQKLEECGKHNKTQLQAKEDLEISTKLIYTEDPLEFSKLRRNLKNENKIDEDKLVVFYDKDYKMIYFHVERVYNSKRKLDSRNQIAFIVSYLLDRNIPKEDIKTMCHVLNTGQYAIMDLNIDKNMLYVGMKARTLAEGILNI